MGSSGTPQTGSSFPSLLFISGLGEVPHTIPNFTSLLPPSSTNSKPLKATCAPMLVTSSVLTIGGPVNIPVLKEISGSA